MEDRIRNIETRVEASATIPAPAKAELLGLLAELRGELLRVEKGHLDRAAAAGHGDGVLDGLMALEATHPRVAALANRLAVALANMGI